jgi:glycosyltransferase involved in cell wall biosynthesis
MDIVDMWVTRTRQAYNQFKSIDVDNFMIPYLVDTSTFRPLEHDDHDVKALRARFNIPSDKYLIGNFQRDTEGSDLKTPKLVKGPDILLEILKGLKKRGMNFHVILAGPRRHWLRKKLAEHDIAFTFIGETVDCDDLQVNSLPRTTLNLLYNMIDLYVVASRSEGGPHSILEACASKTRVISSDVGTARDNLPEKGIFQAPDVAMDIIADDMERSSLDDTIIPNLDNVTVKNTAQAARPLFLKLYNELATSEKPTRSACRSASLKRQSERLQAPGHVSRSRRFTVGLWHSFFKPPYGGGNQFMMALRKGLTQLGVDVRENELTEEIDAYILNSIHFDVERFLEFGKKHRLNVVHRIDGPIHMIRGFDLEKDQLCYELNDKFAGATVLQSNWVYQNIVKLNYHPVSPTVILNAVDSDIFHSKGRVAFNKNRKIRLISSSWSNNPRKGGPVYGWIEKNLDWSRFEYTFVGNASEEFSRIRKVDPVPSEDLADLLRQHDIYITASRNDPCSNAVIEALSCGLPALYLNDGGHPELVGTGGLPFMTNEEILPQLDRLVENYEMFQNLIVVSKLRDVASKYLSIAQDIAR